MDALERAFLNEYPHSEVRRESDEPESENIPRGSTESTAATNGVTAGFRSARRQSGNDSGGSGVELRCDAPAGRIRSAQVFSDAMDGEMILSLAKTLEGPSILMERDGGRGARGVSRLARNGGCGGVA